MLEKCEIFKNCFDQTVINQLTRHPFIDIILAIIFTICCFNVIKVNKFCARRNRVNKFRDLIENYSSQNSIPRPY